MPSPGRLRPGPADRDTAKRQSRTWGRVSESDAPQAQAFLGERDSVPSSSWMFGLVKAAQEKALAHHNHRSPNWTRTFKLFKFLQVLGASLRPEPAASRDLFSPYQAGTLLLPISTFTSMLGWVSCQPGSMGELSVARDHQSR
jgi:hypothetical protein